MATAASHASAAPSTDGRVRRSVRSRASIVNALFELIGEGSVQPTAQEVAARAGVAMRSVFRHFSDLESLFASIDERLRLEVAPLLLDAQPLGSLSTRVRAMVRLRATVFERIAPYKRSADLQRWRSPFIRSQQQDLVRELRAGLRRWVPELATAPAELTEALDLVTSFDAWNRLRTEQRLPPARTLAVMDRMASAIVAPLDDHDARRSAAGRDGRPARTSRSKEKR